jgi:hypothetical protein
MCTSFVINSLHHFYRNRTIGICSFRVTHNGSGLLHFTFIHSSDYLNDWIADCLLVIEKLPNYL